MERRSCQVLIVGAGITGLTIARELLLRGAEDIVILEKEGSLGFHASGRNSGVLHAGIYYTPYYEEKEALHVVQIQRARNS